MTSGPLGIRTYVQNLLERIPSLDCLNHSFPSNNFLWNHSRAPMAQFSHRWDLYHAPAYTAPLLNFCPLIVTTADISYLAHEEWYPHRMDPFRRRYYASSLKRADRIIVTSEFSRDEVLRLFPDLEPRVRRIYLAASEFFEKDEGLAAQVRRQLGLPEHFILHVGDIHPRRNVEKLAAAAEKVRLPLVLVGRLLQGAAALARRPHLYQGLNERELKGVYSAATVFAYASVYEGFGLPVLEAMACGLPVVCSNRSCLPEVCGDAAVLVDPEVDALVEGIQRVLTDHEGYAARGLIQARNFSWDKTAAQTLKVYRELTSSTDPVRTPR